MMIQCVSAHIAYQGRWWDSTADVLLMPDACTYAAFVLYLVADVYWLVVTLHAKSTVTMTAM